MGLCDVSAHFSHFGNLLKSCFCIFFIHNDLSDSLCTQDHILCLDSHFGSAWRDEQRGVDRCYPVHCDTAA